MFFSHDRYVFAECPKLKAKGSKIKFYFAHQLKKEFQIK
jgi:hypothetical protein